VDYPRYYGPFAPRQPVFVPSLLGDLELVTAPATYPVALNDVKSNSRIEIDDDNDLINNFIIPAATEYCERSFDGHRQLITATYDLPVAWWWNGEIALPRPPLQSITSVKYYDSAGTLQTLDSGRYLVRTPMKLPGRISRAPLGSWPALQADRQWPIVIRFVCGYGDDATDVPASIRQAILLFCGHLYENREATVVGNQVPVEIALGVDRLLQKHNFGSYA